ncbi:hypothetical protein EZS27_029989 [termite gut metagenome]|uniref:Uncharacterized protein n=1 Tax=termite gut metagenome TaxID=433724 RepID=A0A5J4QGW4_9ZZZZ
MNNETQLTPEILQAVKNLQREGYVPMLIEQLEEILDFFIDTDLDTSQRLDYIQILRSTQKSLRPFSVEEGGES